MCKVSEFSAQDHALVTAAVGEAEKATDGEIVTVVASQSDNYADIAWVVAGLASLTALLLVALFPEFYLGKLEWLMGGRSSWNSLPYWVLFVVAAVKFFAVRAVLIWRPLRLLLTPPAIKRVRVARRADSLFQVSTNHRTAGRTGILLYLSMREHRAEIIADEAIAGKVSADVWGEAMVALIDHVRDGKPGEGMAEAVRQMGLVLTEHFPKSDGNPNELPDRLIEL